MINTFVSIRIVRCVSYILLMMSKLFKQSKHNLFRHKVNGSFLTEKRQYNIAKSEVIHCGRSQAIRGRPTFYSHDLDNSLNRLIPCYFFLNDSSERRRDYCGADRTYIAGTKNGSPFPKRVSKHDSNRMC